MRRHTADTAITAALRDLDPAATTDLTDAEQGRADATFARIVTTPSGGPVPVERDRPRRRRRLLVTAGLVGAAGLATPLLLGGGTAFGSWTPTPETLTGAAATKAATTCRDRFGVPRQEGHVEVAERRGGWTYVVLAGPRLEAICLMPNDFVEKEGRAERGGIGTYSPNRAPVPPTLVPDRIAENTSGGSSVPATGWWPFRADDGWFNWVEGYVGSGVTGVTVHTSSGLDIEASVASNRFAAWWPGMVQSSHNPDETWSYTVHLADGSTRRTECSQSTQTC